MRRSVLLALWMALTCLTGLALQWMFIQLHVTLIYLLTPVHVDLYMFAVSFPTWSWEQGILFLLFICTFCPDFFLELNNIVVDYLLTSHIAYSHIECDIESKHNCPCLLHDLMINLRSISLGTVCHKRKDCRHYDSPTEARSLVPRLAPRGLPALVPHCVIWTERGRSADMT